jgi:hypothetical protein
MKRQRSLAYWLAYLDRQELIGVQTFIAQLAVEGLDEAVFYGLPRSDEVEQYTPLVRPLIEHARSEFRAVIDRDRLRLARRPQIFFERFLRSV